MPWIYPDIFQNGEVLDEFPCAHELNFKIMLTPESCLQFKNDFLVFPEYAVSFPEQVIVFIPRSFWNVTVKLVSLILTSFHYFWVGPLLFSSGQLVFSFLLRIL